MNRIKVAVAGAAGRMGREVVKSVLSQEDMLLVAAVDPIGTGNDAGLLAGTREAGIVIREGLDQALKDSQAEVLVDFTAPDTVMQNLRIAIGRGVAVVVGTTGINAEALNEISSLTAAHKGRVVVAPNFALGAVLMMHFASIAARYCKRAEIIELHHDDKKDAPSGTAVKTAEMILATRAEDNPGHESEETLPGARGGNLDGIRLHSVRLPGLVAHQEVLFGLEGQLLSIRHDSFSRISFMPGVMLAIREVMHRPGVTYGLERLLDL